MPSATSHRQKRAYQPSNPITRYFSPSSSCDAEPSQEPRAPVLPVDVQSNLLSVGMRVRKSVPEGYRTHKVGFHDVQTTSIHLNNDEQAAEPLDDQPRELQPLCGLLKVGGHAVQPSAGGRGLNHSALDASAFAVQSEAFGFPSSQESTTSTMSSISTDSVGAQRVLPPKRSSHKRDFEDEENDEPSQTANIIPSDSVFSQDANVFNEVAPRPMAMPRSRLRRSSRLQLQQGFQIPNFEEMAMPDFEEAAFFKPEEFTAKDRDADMDW